jgi:YidC/Oxa1 family membrane protein insertase
VEKRLPFILLVTLGLFLGWSLIFGPKPEDKAANAAAPTVQDGGASHSPLLSAGPEGSSAEPIVQADAWVETVQLGQPGDAIRYEATFDSLGGTLRSLRLHGWYLSGKLPDSKKEETGNWVPLLDAPINGVGQQPGSLLLVGGPSAKGLFAADPSTLHWDHELIVEDGSTEGVIFTLTSPNGLSLTKTIRRSTEHHELLVDLTFTNTGDTVAPGVRSFILSPAIGVPKSSEDKWYLEPTARKGVFDGGEIEIENEEVAATAAKDNRVGEFPDFDGTAFVGVDNKYFAVLLRAADTDTAGTFRSTRWARVWDTGWVNEHPDRRAEGFQHVITQQELDLSIPVAGGESSYHFKLYAGPKQENEMEAADERLVSLLQSDLGFFDGIGTVLLTILRFFEGIFGNWGVAIIILTLCVRLALFPMNRRSQTAMARHATKMKRVQPKLNEIKEKYANNPQKLRQEQARIMQEEGAFPPLGGCLPMFLQIPVFFGLYQALRVAFDLRQASFLWVNDLSMPDRLWPTGMDMSLPMVGSIEYLNVLPPTMVFLWILQQKLMPKPTDEQALKMQKMMMWMPILFGFFLYNYAAGLSLYMITSSLFGICEYTVIRKIWPIDDSEKKRKQGKFMKRLMDLQEQAQQAEKQKQAQRAKSGGKKVKKR